MQESYNESGSPGPNNQEKTRTEPQGFYDLNGYRMSNFNNAFAGNSFGDVGLGDFLLGIRDGKWSVPVLRVRKILREDGEAIYREQKKLLPAVSLSGTMTGPRKYAPPQGRLLHNGLMQVDFDRKDHPDTTVEEIKALLIASGDCLTVFESPSGQGVKAVVRIQANLETHERSFHAVEKRFQELGLKIDKNTKDAGRLMLVSYDPDLWLNSVQPRVIPPLSAGETPKTRSAAQSTKPYSGICEEIREILTYIPPRPDYEKWIRVVWAVYESVGFEKGLPLLKQWSPEEIPGEYEKLYQPDKTGNKVSIATLVKFAKEGGYVPRPRIPHDVIPVPGGRISHYKSSEIIFATLASKGGVYLRGGKVVEVVVDRSGGARIEYVTPERLVEHCERLGKRVAKLEFVKADSRDETKTHSGDGSSQARHVWRSCTMPTSAAKIALQSEAARHLLPPLRQVVNAPIIVETGAGQSRILGHGYHPEYGGVFVVSKIEPEKMSGDFFVAAELLKHLVRDFRFATDSDHSRAVASLISPALKPGNLINGDFPLDYAEADQSQSGKTYRQKAVVTLYNEIPSVITTRNRGVGGFDESVANALLSGGLFIAMDNMRGDVKSQLLETAIRGHGYADCRGFQASGRVDVTPFLWQLSTNGAEPTTDLANRSIIVRNLKQPPDYKFMEFAEGDLIAHISGRRSLYLAAVFEIVGEWIRRGKPRTADVRHDFREWAQSLDWIVQNLCGMRPLLDGHREQQLRNSDPGLQWLRNVLLAAGPFDAEMVATASRLAEIAVTAGIDLPGTPTREEPSIRVGKILGGIFGRAGCEQIVVGCFRVSREKVPVNTGHGPKLKHQYRVGRSGNDVPPVPPCSPPFA